MPPQGCWRHAVGASDELLVGWPDDQLAVARKRRVRMERQQRVENGQSAISGAQSDPGVLDILEDMPFVYGHVLRHRPCGDLTCNHPKRHRPPPKGRRRVFTRHFSHLSVRQKKSARRSGATTLDSDSGKCDSQLATDREGLPRRRRSGAFFFCGFSLLFSSPFPTPEKPRKAHRACRR
jgi:hypothetical protein